jgi:prepilin-type N-terminal cleavage/methylation domain-containing protein
MRSERGYTLVELAVVLLLIGVLSGIALPVFLSSNQMSALWTNSERIGAIIRQTRLKAITTNTSYELRFDCPSAGEIRALIVDADIADGNRCNMNKDQDSQIVDMSNGVEFTHGDATGIDITGRGVFTPIGDAIPLTIVVNYGDNVRYLTVSRTGQITFSDTEPE